MASWSSRSSVCRRTIPTHRHPVATERSGRRIATTKWSLILQVTLVPQFVPQVSHHANVTDDVLKTRIFCRIVNLLFRIERPNQPRIVAAHYFIAICQELFGKRLHSDRQSLWVKCLCVQTGETR